MKEGSQRSRPESFNNRRRASLVARAAIGEMAMEDRRLWLGERRGASAGDSI